jgi:hypothetical protein
MSEVPGASLLITGKEVVRIDTRREFAVSQCPPMLTARDGHAAVYHTPHLYILGGYERSRTLRECERYVCAENRWETLPPLPRACSATSGVVVKRTLYALGGLVRGTPSDLIQKLSLDYLSWDIMHLRLPHSEAAIPCFKVRDTEVYLVVKKTLCSFTAFEVRPIKTLTKSIQSRSGASYYHRGTLYCPSGRAVGRLKIGSLSK